MMVPSVGAAARGRSRSPPGEDDPEQAGMPARERIEIARAMEVSAACPAAIKDRNGPFRAGANIVGGRAEIT
jgi:hypothetical protein